MATPMFRSRHLTLLIALPMRHGLLVVNLIGAAVLIAGSYSISDRRHFLFIAIVLSGASLVGNWWMVMYPGHVTVAIAYSITIVLLSFFAITTLGSSTAANGASNGLLRFVVIQKFADVISFFSSVRPHDHPIVDFTFRNTNALSLLVAVNEINSAKKAGYFTVLNLFNS